MNLRSGIHCTILGGGILLLQAGCVIAPVPLVEVEIQHPWSGQDAQGRNMAIEAHQKNWYLPVLVSPEGASKLPKGKCDYRYFLVQDDRKKQAELTFLKLEGVDYSGWLIHGLHGTSYLKAERVSSWGPGGHVSPPPEIVQIDIVVFERANLKHRRTLTSLNWRGTGKGNEVWDRFKEEADGRYVIYKTPDGFRRYDAWKDIDAPVPPGEMVN